jgi:hypothetical protein
MAIGLSRQWLVPVLLQRSIGTDVCGYTRSSSNPGEPGSAFVVVMPSLRGTAAKGVMAARGEEVRACPLYMIWTGS